MKDVVTVGEVQLSEIRTRPDYAVTVLNALAGWIEVKAPGKGANPRSYKDKHDKEQWDKLKSLPNIMYTDGNQFSLWRYGELQGTIIQLKGDVYSSGAALDAPLALIGLFEDFFRWQPESPKTPRRLAVITANLCKLLRSEVVEQLKLGSEALTSLAADWKHLLFPDATNEKFADGYAQAVTFGMLMARSQDISFSDGLGSAAKKLADTSSLIGSALRLLTDDAENQKTLRTSLGTLARVLDKVEWTVISKGNPEAWLYFYEDFLDIYDRKIRKQTGSYYTPPQVVESMVDLVDEVLRERFEIPEGLASSKVTIADPAVGTGTFVLGVIKKIAETINENEGEGAVAANLLQAVSRVIAFELQLGPFAVAQMRILAELRELIDNDFVMPKLRMYVTDTLANPYVEEAYLGNSMVKSIAESRKHANAIKRDEPIMVVLGNPPYKEKAKGLGGWVESAGENSPEKAPLSAWMPPRNWGVGVHAKHLRNLYTYFWRWATWKVFDHNPKFPQGVICFITVSGFLTGPGFERMREYMRQNADDIWVIDCSPEGHQPAVSSRIFESVQQPVCIVLMSASASNDKSMPATVHFKRLASGHRTEKFAELSSTRIRDIGQWISASKDWRAPFTPKSGDAWNSYPSLDSLFVYNGSGVMPGRTWVISPDEETLSQRWNTLLNASTEEKEILFHPHMRNGQPGDKHAAKEGTRGLHGHEERLASVMNDQKPAVKPTRYGYRTLDRQFIIPDSRVINQVNPKLWENHSSKQIYLTALSRTSPRSGPAVSFTNLIPDIDHYKGSFGGRVYPLYRDEKATLSNIDPSVLQLLSEKFGVAITGEQVFCYIACVLAHPGFIAKFDAELRTPGLRVPFTGDYALFKQAFEIGAEIVWLFTFGENFLISSRPKRIPRLEKARQPSIPKSGAIPLESDRMPDDIWYDPVKQQLHVGEGYIDNVSPKVWDYEVSGKSILKQWFSYRKKNRERPSIGEKRAPSKLELIQSESWLGEYSSELINLLNILQMLVDLEPSQSKVLEQILGSNMFTEDELISLKSKTSTKKDLRTSTQQEILDL